MKVIGVITVVISISAILSYNPGVPTLGSDSVYKIEAVTATDKSINTSPLPTYVNGMGLNPPHGRPGHRCDIAVGQPLSSKPATQPSTAFIPVTNTSTPANNPTKPFRVPFMQPAAGLNPPHGQPGHRCDLRVGQPLDSKPATQPSTAFNPVTNASSTPATNPAKPFTVPFIQPAAGLNPPHGQPGHRCDIRVGQPLDSKPFTTTPTTNYTPMTNSMALASGLNPKHGQPGHRCDIRVGQPLNSKPFTTTPTSNFTPTTNSMAVAYGLNPKHGQPGHRCDILVGQPLNSKPAQTSLQTNQ